MGHNSSIQSLQLKPCSPKHPRSQNFIDVTSTFLNCYEIQQWGSNFIIDNDI